MKTRSAVKLFLVSLSFFLVVVSPSFAAPNPRSVSSLERNILRLQKKLARKFDRLSAAGKLKVIESRIGSSDDSDSDGVPDNLESSSGRCDSDSDDDGVTDGDEYSNGTDPNDQDSDDDGYNDGDEFEVHGIIAAKDGTSITIGTTVYLIDGSTEYLDENKNPVTFDFYMAGDCVNIEGHNQSTDKILEKIKPDDDCVS